MTSGQQIPESIDIESGESDGKDSDVEDKFYYCLNLAIIFRIYFAIF